ncbi:MULTISPECIES: radical SAM protein [Bacteroides]|uniref:radical SAM protein n=1 Tax=Bacteroides TaxID=816 RepID=UPI001D8A51ED|nr:MULTISPECIES: radical SAM protein [Bacteroides]HJD93128.1 radical SAM protein [Bacteroides coprosuis]
MTIIFPSPVFGPVKSRRLGISLGINLLPSDGKVCSFDCIYCECGLNGENRPSSPLPTRQEVKDHLEDKLQEMVATQELPDVITFAGNGEPTIHPNFSEIIDDTIKLRDKYAPRAKVSVLSNATFLHRPATVKALHKVDNNILKLDTVDMPFINLVNQPNCNYDVAKTIELMKMLDGDLIIQTMFLKGEYKGNSVDNTGSEFVEPWIAQLKQINPRQVMIYTIDRETPVKGLLKASKEELDEIGERLKEENFNVSISY